MGMISKLLSFTRKDVGSVSTVNPGGGFNLSADHFSAPGDDSYPLPGDYPALVETQRTGGVAAVGYMDPKSEQKAAAGEKRIYSRDGDGNAVVELWLKADGSAILSNALGSIQLKADGSVDINGVTIDADGNTNINGVEIDDSGAVEVPLSLKVNSKELDLHVHPGVTVGTGSTGPL